MHIENWFASAVLALCSFWAIAEFSGRWGKPPVVNNEENANAVKLHSTDWINCTPDSIITIKVIYKDSVIMVLGFESLMR